MIPEQWTWLLCSVCAAKSPVIARIKSNNRNWAADFRFSRNFWFLVPISREGANARFAPICGRPWCYGALNSVAIKPFDLFFTRWFVPSTTVWWTSHEKFIYSLADIFFMTCDTSRYKSTIVCTCQVFSQRERFTFSHYLWNTWYHWFVAFSLASTKRTVVARSWQEYYLLLCLAWCKMIVVFISSRPIVVDLL